MTDPAPKPKRKPRKAPAKKTSPAPAPAVERLEIGNVLEPDWTALLTNEAEREIASGHWQRIAREMHEREILSSSNGHAVQRLVLAYLVYNRCSTEVASGGIVDETDNEKNPKAIARLSIHYKAMREAENTAERLEAQLGLSPGRRGKVAKVVAKRARGADEARRGEEERRRARPCRAAFACSGGCSQSRPINIRSNKQRGRSPRLFACGAHLPGQRIK